MTGSAPPARATRPSAAVERPLLLLTSAPLLPLVLLVNCPIARVSHMAGYRGAVPKGKMDSDVPNRKGLGSRVLFQEYVELGFRATRVLSLSVFLDHMSNANLARRNAGMTDVGLRTGFKF